MYIRARVTADARNDSVRKTKDGSYTISVRVPAEGNQANRRVRELIAKEFDLTFAQVHIVSGQHKGSKMIHIDN